MTSIQNDKLEHLDAWLHSALGQQVAFSFQKEIDKVFSEHQGETILQLGSCGGVSFAAQLHFSLQLIISPIKGKNTNILAPLNALPFDKESADCVVAPLINELFMHEKKPLDEIDRILKPMGQIIFIGINPFSFWGLWLKTSANNCFGARTSPYSAFSLKRALQHRGYKQLYFSTFYYFPPLPYAPFIQKFFLINTIGKILAPWPAGFYCLIVEKCVENPLRLHSLPVQEPLYSFS